MLSSISCLATADISDGNWWLQTRNVVKIRDVWKKLINSCHVDGTVYSNYDHVSNQFECFSKILPSSLSFTLSLPPLSNAIKALQAAWRCFPVSRRRNHLFLRDAFAVPVCWRWSAIHPFASKRSSWPAFIRAVLVKKIIIISLTDTGLRCMWSNIGSEKKIKRTPRYPSLQQAPSEGLKWLTSDYICNAS